jgi:hypothetical protein
MDYSVGHIILVLASSSIHFWISKQAKHSKISSGSILRHASYTLFSALLMRESNQLMKEEVFIHIARLIRDKMYEE